MGLHLGKNRRDRLSAPFDGVIEAHLAQAATDWKQEVCHLLLLRNVRHGDFFFNLPVFLRVFVNHHRLFHILFDIIKAQTVSDRNHQIFCNLEEFLGIWIDIALIAAVAEAMGNDEHHHTDVVNHRKEKLTESIGLG